MRILGLGDNVCDIYVDRKKGYAGGNALNFAVNAAKLGHEAHFVGVFGNDRIGRFQQETAVRMGVNIAFAPVVEGENGYAQVTHVNGDRRFICSNHGGVTGQLGSYLEGERLEYILDFPLIMSGIFAHLEDHLHILKERKGILAFDFSTRRGAEWIEKICPWIDVALFSATDLDLAGEQELVQCVQALGCRDVLLTRGEEGAVLYYNNQVYRAVPEKVVAVDSMGAGDAFFSSLMCSLLEPETGLSEPEIVTKALAKAGEHAATVCLLDGSFGIYTDLDEVNDQKYLTIQERMW